MEMVLRYKRGMSLGEREVCGVGEWDWRGVLGKSFQHLVALGQQQCNSLSAVCRSLLSVLFSWSSFFLTFFPYSSLSFATFFYFFQFLSLTPPTPFSPACLPAVFFRSLTLVSFPFQLLLDWSDLKRSAVGKVSSKGGEGMERGWEESWTEVFVMCLGGILFCFVFLDYSGEFLLSCFFG